MVSQNNSTITARFLDPWPWLSLMATGLMFYFSLSSPAYRQGMLATYITVEPDEQEAVTSPFMLNPSDVGALRVFVKANIPEGRWLTYEIQLRDAQGEVVAAALKEAWHESGPWYEDGESGTWHESDVRGGLDVRSRQPETVTLSLAVLDYTNTAGQGIDEPISFWVDVSNGVVDTTYFWPGVVGTTLLSLLALWATRHSGDQVIVASVEDSDPSDRAILGGADSLVRADIDIWGDETSPQQFQVQVNISDGTGTVIHSQEYPIRPTMHKDDGGKLERTTASLKLFFLIQPLSSYRFSVEVLPDGPIDRTTLTVARDARTRLPVKVTQLKAV